MNEDCLKLTSYFGERDRANGGFVADAFSEIFARHELRTSLVMRGVEGFGAKHLRHTDRLLSLSEDLPIISVAVDGRSRIEAALREVAALEFEGLVTLERARMITGPRIEAVDAAALGEATKLTVYVGRHERIGAAPAHQAIVALMHARGVAGAAVLLGVDGTAHGERRRARFFGRNTAVPLMVIAVAASDRIAAVLPELGALLDQPLMTLERVRICSRDGERLAGPHDVREADAAGPQMWQKLMIYAGEQSHHRGRPLSGVLVRALQIGRAHV